MSKEVVVQSWCDGDHEHREPAVKERREMLDGEPYLLDLCETCDKSVQDLYDAMRAWLERGVPVARAQQPPPVPGKRRKKDLTTACNQCDYVGPTRQALGQHLRAVHNMGLKGAGLA